MVPGEPAASLVWQRLVTSDPDERMPPRDSHLSLDEAERALIKRWIGEGAPFEEYWTFIPPVRPEVPALTAPSGTMRNPIDGFVLARLVREAIPASPEADRRTLIRRLSLDLRGLPPSPEEVKAFLEDKSPDAYGELVERFLASPAYGERMAWSWLDAARYADSNGYQGDNDRKYDPLTQRDYYALFDFFNQTPVTGGGGDPQTARSSRPPRWIIKTGCGNCRGRSIPLDSNCRAPKAPPASEVGARPPSLRVHDLDGRGWDQTGNQLRGNR